MRHRNHRTTALLSATAVLALLTGCGTSNADAIGEDGSIDLSAVTLVVGDQKGGSQALLTASGQLDEVEYAIEFKPFTSGPPLLDAVHTAAVDLGGVGNTPPLFAIDQDKDLKVVQASRQGAHSDAIVVKEDSPVSSVADLAGKKVAVAKGSSANYHLLAQLEKAGLGWDDIEPVFLQPTEALAAFTGGHVDAWAIWDPFTAQAELTAQARILTSGEGVVNGIGFQVASDAALEDPATSAAIEDYLTRIARAQQWANDHPDEWADAWAAETGLPSEVTRRAIERRDYQPIAVSDAVPSEQEMWDAFTEQGQLTRQDVDLGSYFIDRFDDAVLATTKEN
ncbi:ABC transporter substrate-binding protein [Aeromicrobium camelliae]|uniref:Putative aliphatic sulfonates-binding protein n=1 Tax=Aeromicrobium camelliae TaxID=1538144 RepID=A0A3N6ZNN0_9ACTN|nr:ABC transporter substrate-binding protein [Aeromicrobium camelliae]RQN08667.1 ABC transporter substrate-binding protein [Aeromicrobium camelliae]